MTIKLGSYAAALALGWALLAVLVVVFRRTNRQLAAALARHLGFEVTPSTLPSFRSLTAFDGAVTEMREQGSRSPLT